MQRFLIANASNYIGEKVNVSGWVNVVRKHGKIIFIDLRDKSGVIQCVFVPSQKEAYEKVESVRPEWVIEISGQVIKRPENMINPDLPSGQVELSVEKLNILSIAQTLPFAIDGDGYDIKEEVRMKYRYLDLRRERAKNNLVMRHKVTKFIRDFLSEDGFIEIETPILTKSTPEGARDFVVPSRLQPGKFYALPQSPQQYKQLFMVAGFEKYFQIAKCLRDEDPRGDRQAEHTQIDMELSFINREEIFDLIERMMVNLVKVIFPGKKIQETPFPVITHKEAIEKHKTDKPDLRKNKEDKDELAFCWIVDFPFFEKKDDGKWTFAHNPFSSPQSEYMQDLMEKKNIENIVANQYDLVLNGFEIASGGIRNNNPEALKKVFEIIGYKDKEIQENFGHILDAFSFGTPPHGGIAPGLDRILMILQNEPNIREVIAFPKTGDGHDLMMKTPDEISKDQLKELHIKVSKTISKTNPKIKSKKVNDKTKKTNKKAEK